MFPFLRGPSKSWFQSSIVLLRQRKFQLLWRNRSQRSDDHVCRDDECWHRSIKLSCWSPAEAFKSSPPPEKKKWKFLMQDTRRGGFEANPLTWEEKKELSSSNWSSNTVPKRPRWYLKLLTLFGMSSAPPKDLFTQTNDTFVSTVGKTVVFEQEQS